MSSTQAAAEAFVRSYAAAIESPCFDPNVNLEDCAATLARHFSPRTISFVNGHIALPSDKPDFWRHAIALHLRRFEKAGLGLKIRLESSDVKVVSETAAACFVTWHIEPKDGREGWGWVNVYGWRKSGDGEGEGYWEYTISDNEYGELLKRVPDFMELDV